MHQICMTFSLQFGQRMRYQLTTYNQLNCHCLSMILLVFLYIPMAMYMKESWGFFPSYLLWWYCIIVFLMWMLKVANLTQLLMFWQVCLSLRRYRNSLFVIIFKQLKELEDKWQKIRQKESKNSQVNSQILNNKVKEWIQLECNSYGVMLKQFYLRKGHKPSLKVMRDDRFN